MTLSPQKKGSEVRGKRENHQVLSGRGVTDGEEVDPMD